MAKTSRLIQQLPLAPVIALMFGTAAAALVATTPIWLFEQGVAVSGLASVLDVAQPPFGLKARLLAILLVFAIVATLTWLAVALVERLIAGRRDSVSKAEDVFDLDDFVAPVEPRRGPIFADRELGAPLMSDAALASVAPYAPDPVEIAEAAFEDIEPTSEADPELQAPLALHEFDLPQTEAETPAIAGETSIEALIRRLEAGMSRRDAPRPPDPTPDPATPVSAATLPGRDDWLVPQNGNEPDDDDTVRAMRTLRRMAG